MRILGRLLVCVLLIVQFPIFGALDAQGGQPDRCTDLLKSQSAGRINTAELIPAADGLPDYCKVTGTVSETVNYEVRLPVPASWNGKFLQGGCAGLCGLPPSTYLSAASNGLNGAHTALSRGYAVTATDTGHQGAPNDASFGYNNTRAEIDFGFRSPHIVAVTAKNLIKEYYGDPPKFSYWRGCSTGGRQGLMMAQRYPEDYDGIIVGAAVNYFTGLSPIVHLDNERYNRAGNPNHPKILTVDKLELIRSAVYSACDAIDGLTDGIIDDPRRCDFDPFSLMCPDGNPGATCLSRAQCDVLRKFYDAPRDRAGKPLFPGGLAKGGEGAWNPNIIGVGDDLGRLCFYNQTQFAYMMFPKDPGPSYSLWDFDIERDMSLLHPNAHIYNADDYDMSGFRGRGGKLIQYIGWADTSFPPEGTIHYYNHVAERMGGLNEVKKWYRLFMIPGMYHCGGGPGPNSFDPLTALENWVEHGMAPDQMIATGGTVAPTRTRPLCPYPKVARYQGSGSIDLAANFTCVDPDYKIPARDFDAIDRWPWQ